MGTGLISSGLQFSTGINGGERTIEDSLKELESLVIMSTPMGNVPKVEFKTSLANKEDQDLNVIRHKINNNRQFNLSTFDSSIDYTRRLNVSSDYHDFNLNCSANNDSNSDSITCSTISFNTLDSSAVPRSFNTKIEEPLTPWSLLSSLGIDSLNQNRQKETMGYGNNYSYDKVYPTLENNLYSMNMNGNLKRQVKSNAIIPSWINIPPNSKFFIIKCNNIEHIKKSFYNSIWSSTHFGNKRLSESYRNLDLDTNAKLFLFFSVNGSGKFCGVAEMTSDLRDDLDTTIWTESEKFGNAFKVRWLIVRDINNKYLKRFLLPNNEMKPVTNSRDTQEVPPLIGTGMIKLFKSQSFQQYTTSFLDDEN